MTAQSRILRFFIAPLTFWTVLFVAGVYFVFSFNMKSFKEQIAASSGGFTKYFSAAYDALSLSRVKKGIDLAGGTYLVLGVELEKAIEKRIANELRSVDQLFVTKKLEKLPSKRDLKKDSFELTFEDEEVAKSALNMIQDAKNSGLAVKRSGAVLTATLSSELEKSIRTGAVEQAVSVLSTRLGSYGVEGIVVQQHGDHQVVVQLPGVSDPDRVKSVITQTAHLEFKIVQKMAATEAALLDQYDGDLPSDLMVIPGRKADDEVAGRYYLVSAFADVNGDRITDARVDFDQYGKAVVNFKLDSAGAQEFGELTSENVGRQLGIIIDNVMYSAPSISTAIPGGSGVITGVGNQKDALDLSIVLRSGSLQAPLKFEQESRVGASLGQDSIYKGMLSCVVALIVLFFFSLLFYKIPGFYAVLALLYNLFLILAFLSYFGATLTLPGIAGMVLTIGMAIDASILIYERIKEEIKAGVALRAAVNNGFRDAMVVILDSNITTFLTGVVLFWFGGPAIRGFAVTIMAGIIATVLAGVYFLKSLFTFTTDVCNVRSLKF